jgi:hypothetical protein
MFSTRLDASVDARLAGQTIARLLILRRLFARSSCRRAQSTTRPHAVGAHGIRLGFRDALKRGSPDCRASRREISARPESPRAFPTQLEFQFK